MRILYFAFTPFQVISSLAIKEEYYKNDENDIILSDTIQLRDIMKENILKNNFFQNVYFENTYKYFNKRKSRIKFEINRVRSAFNSTYLARDIGLDEIHYDCFVTKDITYYTESIFSLLKKYNKDLRVELMDEGYSSYTYYFREAYKPQTLKKKTFFFLFRIPGKIMGRKFISEEAKKVYLYSPELLDWDDNPYEIKKIGMKDNELFLKKINDLFGYDKTFKKHIEDEYKEKYIFFEESFFWTIGNNRDESLVEYISDVVGKKNFMIKLHPRNLINRFEDKGYNTNQIHGIPWELIAINLPPEDNKVFLTISSGAVLNYRFLKSLSFKTILLYKCVGDYYRHIDKNLIEWFERYKKTYSEALYIPETIDEMDELLNSFSKEI